MTYSIQRVRVIAYLFIAFGIASWIQFGITYWANGGILPGIEMVLLPAGLGLLRRKETWRKISVGLIAVGISVMIAVPILGYTISPVMHVRIHGADLDPNSPVAIVFVVAYVLLLVICHAWVLLALRHSEVKAFFSHK